MSTVGEIIKQYPYIETELLLAHVLRKPKEFLYLNGEYNLTNKQFNNLTKLISRRQKGEPVAYVLGYKDFCGLRFKVNKDVLVPRPETETLVDLVEQALGLQITKQQATGLHYEGPHTMRILDVGTGSGCIAVSIADRIKVKRLKLKVKITALDISQKALKVARENAKKHHAKIKLLKSDLFQNIKGQYDIVVANLPYVPLKFIRRVLEGQKTQQIKGSTAVEPFGGLKYEPKFALSDGTNSWQIYMRFFKQVANYIKPNGVIFLEIDPSSRRLLAEYQKKYLPDWQIQFYRDIYKRWRFARVCRKAVS